MLLTLGRVAVALASIALAVLALRSALRTIVVPRGIPGRRRQRMGSCMVMVRRARLRAVAPGVGLAPAR
jgi:hypothetical protein